MLAGHRKRPEPVEPTADPVDRRRVGDGAEIALEGLERGLDQALPPRLRLLRALLHQAGEPVGDTLRQLGEGALLEQLDQRPAVDRSLRDATAPPAPSDGDQPWHARDGRVGMLDRAQRLRLAVEGRIGGRHATELDDDGRLRVTALERQGGNLVDAAVPAGEQQWAGAVGQDVVERVGHRARGLLLGEAPDRAGRREKAGAGHQSPEEAGDRPGRRARGPPGEKLRHRLGGIERQPELRQAERLRTRPQDPDVGQARAAHPARGAPGPARAGDAPEADHGPAEPDRVSRRAEREPGGEAGHRHVGGPRHRLAPSQQAQRPRVGACAQVGEQGLVRLGDEEAPIHPAQERVELRLGSALSCRRGFHLRAGHGRRVRWRGPSPRA